eukprot:XP_017948211.1 PREDICTED: vomeronasal type-2 receptor 26-like [Xenopus tropicalis]
MDVPISKCSPSCLSGFRKVILPGKPLCCYECARCPQGQISNITDAAECNPCSWDTWPNLQQDRCLPRPTEFLSYGDPLGYSLAAISVFSSLIPLGVLGVFIYHKKTPIVRANNYSLSCLLLLSLFLCFLCSLGFIGYPQPEKCLLRQVAFGMVFALCISCVLAKTITVVIAFNATKPGSRFSLEHFQSMEALIFAVEEINVDPELLPHITLGFQIFDTCIALRQAVYGALWMLSGGQGISPNYQCHKEAPLADRFHFPQLLHFVSTDQLFGN